MPRNRYFASYVRPTSGGVPARRELHGGLPLGDPVHVDLECVVERQVDGEGRRDAERLGPVARVPDRVERALAPGERLLLADDGIGEAGAQRRLVPGERVPRRETRGDAGGEGPRLGGEGGVGLRAGDDLGRFAHGQRGPCRPWSRATLRGPGRSGIPRMDHDGAGSCYGHRHGYGCRRGRAPRARGRARGRRAVCVSRAGSSPPRSASCRSGRSRASRGAEIERAAGPAAQQTPLPDGRTLLQWRATGYHIALIFDKRAAAATA